MTITIGTDSWITLADAETYMAERTGSDQAWTGTLTDAEKEAALKSAYRQLFYMKGYAWPSTITDGQKYAQCEQALMILLSVNDLDRRKSLQAQGVIRAGTVGETYDKDFLDKVPISAVALAMLDSSRDAKGTYAITLERDEEEDVSTD